MFNGNDNSVRRKRVPHFSTCFRIISSCICICDCANCMRYKRQYIFVGRERAKIVKNIDIKCKVSQFLWIEALLLLSCSVHNTTADVCQRYKVIEQRNIQTRAHGEDNEREERRLNVNWHLFEFVINILRHSTYISSLL